MNPYQRIVKGVKILQKGHINTPKKFKQLTKGIDLKNKSVIDIGCNLGTMCYLAEEQGAKAVGIDERRDYIEDARNIYPNITFNVCPAHLITGNYDIAIMSAVFHYFKDYDKVLSKLAQVSKLVLCDIWIEEDNKSEPLFYGTYRKSFIPNEAAWYKIVKPHFKTIKRIGKAETPDKSNRVIYHLSNPIPKKAEAVLISGDGDTGKSTLAASFFDYKNIELDSILLGWHRVKKVPYMSVKEVADSAHANSERAKEYISFHRKYLKLYLDRSIHRDVVINGYDLVYPNYKQMVKDLLKDLGWLKITEISL